MMKSEDKLGNVKFCTALIKSTLLLQMIEQFAARHEACNKIEIGGSLKGEFETDNELGVSRCCADENIALSKCVSYLLLLYNDLLRKDLHSVNTPSILFHHLEYLAKGTC